MEKPKCRVCKIRHWSTEPHVFEPVSTTSKKEIADQVMKLALPEELKGAEALEIEIAEYRARDDARRKYMRDYMQKRRAEEKQK